MPLVAVVVWWATSGGFGGIGAGQESTANDVLEGLVVALGGREALSSHRTMRTTIAVSMPGGATAELVEERQRPNLVRVSMTASGSAPFTRAFDGERGWSLSPLKAVVEQLPPNQAALLAREADLDGALVDPELKGCDVELVGLEEVGGRELFHLTLRRPDSHPDDVEHHWLDGESYLPVTEVVHLRGAGTPIRRERHFSDWREVDGVMISHHMTERQGAGDAWTYVYETVGVEFDVTLSPDAFRLKTPKDVPTRQERSPRPDIEDDPAARSIYAAMVAAYREPRTLTYTSNYQLDVGGMATIHCRYDLWLSKPNQYRMEAFRADGELAGILIGDGSISWTHWPNGRPMMSLDATPLSDAETRGRSYLCKPSPTAGHSIGHDASMLGAGMVMTIFDPSTFHGYTDSLQPLIDAVGLLGTEIVDGEECDKVLVSFMDGQRSWELWIARKDHLPRRLRETVRVHVDLVAEERWTDVTVDEPIGDALFRWSPPADFVEWRPPTSASRLLETGSLAPDFELNLARGGRQRLSDLRGEVVMLVFWRAG